MRDTDIGRSFRKRYKQQNSDGQWDYNLSSRIVVVQTITGKEDLLTTYLEKIGSIRDIVRDTFFPRRQIKKRFHGQWNTVTEKLFPGYLFIETKDSTKLFFEMKRIPMLSRILGDPEASFITLNPEEEEFVRRIGRKRGDHCIGISTVQIETDTPYKKGDKVTVISGDLMDFQGEVVGYDLHKRKAMIQTGMFGGTVIHVGIELLAKA